MKLLPTFYHVPKNAGTYAISVFIGILRKYRAVTRPNFPKELKHESVRNIEIYDNNTIVARLLALDWTNWCEKTDTYVKNPNSPIDYKVELTNLHRNQLPVPCDLEPFTLIVESDGFPIHEKICDSFNFEYNLEKFLIVREPISRQKSIFNYLTSPESVHEYSHHNIKQDPGAQKHFDQFLSRHGRKEDCWIIRTLLDIPVEQPMTDERYNEGVKILDTFTIRDIKHTDDLVAAMYKKCFNIDVKNMEPRFLNAVEKNQSTYKKPINITNIQKVNQHLKYDIHLYNRYK